MEATVLASMRMSRRLSHWSELSKVRLASVSMYRMPHFLSHTISMTAVPSFCFESVTRLTSYSSAQSLFLVSYSVMAANGACFWLIPAQLSKTMHALIQAENRLMSSLLVAFTTIRLKVSNVFGKAVVQTNYSKMLLISSLSFLISLFFICGFPLRFTSMNVLEGSYLLANLASVGPCNEATS